MSILEILRDRKVIREEDIPLIEKEVESGKLSVEQVLISRGVAPEVILESKGLDLDIPLKSLKNVDIPSKVLNYIPQESADHYKFIPISINDGVLEIGIVEPNDMEARDALNFISARAGMPYKLFLISEEDFRTGIGLYKGLTGEVTKALSELETRQRKWRLEN